MAAIQTDVPLFSPVTWLMRGFDDMRKTHCVGAFYGLVFLALGYAL